MKGAAEGGGGKGGRRQMKAAAEEGGGERRPRIKMGVAEVEDGLGSSMVDREPQYPGGGQGKETGGDVSVSWGHSSTSEVASARRSPHTIPDSYESGKELALPRGVPLSGNCTETYCGLRL